MKKIYMLLAVIALLSLSLNAQDVAQSKAKDLLTTQSNKQTEKLDKNMSMSQLLAGIKGMPSVLQPTISPNGTGTFNGPSRAPLKLNAGEELVGPFTTYDTSISGYTGLGFPTSYGNNYQQILITTDLNSSEFADHIGDEIVGFRFALAGNTSQTAILYDFIAWPFAGNNFDQNHQYTWSIPEVAGVAPEIGDIEITVGSGDVNLRSITVYGDNNNVLSSWNSLTGATTSVNLNGTNYASYNLPTGWSTTGYILRWQSDTDGYLGYMSGSPTITLSSSLFAGQNSVRVVINASTDDTSYGIYVNNEGKALTSSLADYTWNLTASVPGYIELQAGQWYEYYLDEPVTFDIGNDITGMRMGYFYLQYPSTETNELLYPIAVNPQSTGHDHASFMYKPNGTTYTYDDMVITLPSGYTNIRSITISSGGNTITSWNYTDNQGTFPTGWGLGGTLGLRYEYDNTNVSLYSSDGTGYLVFSGDMLEGYSNVTVAIYFSTSTRNQTATVGVNGTNRTTTNRTGSTQNWTINGTQTPNYQSGWWSEDFSQYGDLAVQLIFSSGIPKTATPDITYVVNEDNVVITATGNGTVTLTVGGQTVQGEGTVSVTIPRGTTNTTVTATATAQETDKEISNPATEQITIPASGGWLPMDGTYNNPNDLLSFEYQGKEIMLIDQFLASTLLNEHPDGYTYTLRETINNEEKSSNAVNIPVYKTNSSIQGLYTKAQIDEDTDMHLKANAINSEMDYYVHPDRNTLYHSLYRSDKNATYPVIDVDHRISQLQKFDELVGDQVQYFFFENHQENIAPMYDHLGTGIAERVDTKYVTGQAGDELSYVPVIWTFGLYTAREDGKNNSYGSDIKRETLGDVTVQISGSRSGGDNLEEATHNGWEGLFKVGSEYYCIYTPIITINGITPAEKVQNDRDVSTYVPYMYRAWCLYEGARDFKHVMQDNGNGTMVGVLTDNGPLTIPYLLGTEVTENTIGHIGTAWTGGPRLQWAFGVPFDEDPANVPIAVRFYYKKTVNEVAANNMRSANRDGEDENSEEYYIVQVEGSAKDIETAINEFYYGKAIVGITYVNAQGMKSDKPFDGLNIVVTRYSDGTTSTTKVFK